MQTLPQAATSFLESDGIAVAGVSRDPDSPAKAIYLRLKGAGQRVVALNPRATEVDGIPCYPDLQSLPEPVEAVVAVVPAHAAAAVVRDALASGVRRVWLHRAFGQGSVSEEAIELAESNGLDLIPGACPMMFCPPVDFGHRCMRWVLGWTGGLPQPRTGSSVAAGDGASGRD